MDNNYFQRWTNIYLNEKLKDTMEIDKVLNKFCKKINYRIPYGNPTEHISSLPENYLCTHNEIILKDKMDELFYKKNQTRTDRVDKMIKEYSKFIQQKNTSKYHESTKEFPKQIPIAAFGKKKS